MEFSPSAFPDPEKTSVFCEKFNLSLIRSFEHLLDVSENAIGQNLFSLAQLKIETLSQNKKYSGFVHFYNTALIKSVESNNIDEVKKYFSLFAREEIGYQDLFLTYESLNSEKKKLFFQVASYGLPEAPSIYPLDSKKTAILMESIVTALNIIKDQLPDFYQEMSLYLTQFLLFDFSRPVAGSSFDLYGIVYLNISFYKKPIVELIDFIIHETAHLYLYLICCFDPLILNSPDELYEAPFRSDKRPMAGIYHACFVLYRIIHSFQRLIEKKALDHSSLILLEEKYVDYQKKIKKTFFVLDEHAKLTLTGGNLLKKMKESTIF